MCRDITNKQQNCVEDKQFPVTVETRRTYCPLNTDNQSVIAGLDIFFPSIMQLASEKVQSTSINIFLSLI